MLSDISQNLHVNRSRDPEHIPFVGNLSCIHYSIPHYQSAHQIELLAEKTPQPYLLQYEQ